MQYTNNTTQERFVFHPNNNPANNVCGTYWDFVVFIVQNTLIHTEYIQSTKPSISTSTKLTNRRLSFSWSWTKSMYLHLNMSVYYKCIVIWYTFRWMIIIQIIIIQDMDQMVVIMVNRWYVLTFYHILRNGHHLNLYDIIL